MYISQAILLDKAKGWLPFARDRPKRVSNPWDKEQYFYFLTSSKFSVSSSVDNTVQKSVWEMQTEQSYV